MNVIVQLDVVDILPNKQKKVYVIDFNITLAKYFFNNLDIDFYTEFITVKW